MENIVEKISQEIQNNPELNEEINDIGLPKSSLHSFVKEFLSKNKVRGDKNIIPMLDKISRYYVTFISKVGAQICEDCKKKTLNLEHIFEALRQLNFNKHIKLLVDESKNAEDNNGKNEEEDEEKKFENKNLKQMINKKKKRGVRKKKYYENEEEKNLMIQEENDLFEEARLEMLKEESRLEEDQEKQEAENNVVENEPKEEEPKEKNEDEKNIKDNLFINNAGEKDINFDE